MQAPAPSACLIIVGNEILSGRTQDKNLAFLGKTLNELGIRLSETRVVLDIESDIIAAVNACRARYTYVFTTGGIGPTHDDITSASIARAFGVPLIRNKEAEAILERHYGRDQLNAARLKMADVPEGASLIANPVSAAPGFRIENVFVMAGVPSIMQAMFESVRSGLRGGAPMRAKTIAAYLTEGVIAEGLSAIQARHPDTEIGSYPFIRDGKLGTSLVTRAHDEGKLNAAYADIKALLLESTGEVMEE